MRFFFIQFLLILSLSASAIDFYVSPGADTKGDGSYVYPFRTIEEARLAALPFTGKEEVTIWLMEGSYYLNRPIRFTRDDGGTESYPVTYRALKEGSVIISGGRALDLQWKPYRDGIHVCNVPDGLPIDQLFVNQVRQEMARFPNSQSGKNVFDCWTLSHSAQADPDMDPLSKDRISQWNNPEGAYLHAMHRALWGGMHYRVLGKKRNGTLDMEGGWQNNRPDRMHGLYRFIEHVFEELDAPGEWFHNRKEGLLYYYPLPDTDLKNALVEIVTLPHLFEFHGSVENPVTHLHLEGLTLKHTSRTFMDNKEPLLRSDWTTYRGGALFYNGAEHCSVTRCEFDQLGGNSIFVNNYNRYLSFSECHIHQSGANGIAFVGDPATVRNPIYRYGPQDYLKLDLSPGPKGENFPSSCLVYNCLITKTGRTEKQTAAIQISMSHRITVSHCTISDVPRAGINISEGTFGGHIIENSDVFNTVLETGDHGSFNSWGRDRFWDPDIPTMNREVGSNPDLVFLDMLEPNILRNNRWRCDHGWAVDLDDGSSNYIIFNNLLLAGGLKLREGYHRTVYNNIVVNDGLHPHVWPRNNGDVIRANIFFSSHQAIAMNRGMEKDEKWGKEIDHNLFTSSHRDRLLYAKNDCDLNSLVGDPGFKDPSSGDYTVLQDGPAKQIGFKNFEMSRFGVLSPRLRALAAEPEFPEVHINPDTALEDTESTSLILWKDAQLSEPRGESLSAYGVSLNSTGVALVHVPEFSAAWELGFRSGDFIREVNGKGIARTEDFRIHMEKGLQKKKCKVVLVRNQKEKTLLLAF